MGGGVAAALSRKGGPLIQREAMSLAPIAVGAAVVTNAGHLWAKNIIHAPTMEEPGLKVSVESVRRATRAALLAASQRSLPVIAIPGLGTGLGGADPADAARAMVNELRAHKQPNPATVWLVDLNDEVLSNLEEALRTTTP
jgi:O-acetyl-ADP-ribose deacetylase (regulator of RNase III)